MKLFLVIVICFILSAAIVLGIYAWSVKYKRKRDELEVERQKEVLEKKITKIDNMLDIVRLFQSSVSTIPQGGGEKPSPPPPPPPPLPPRKPPVTPVSPPPTPEPKS
ncbi:hypothetical protein FACS1894190_10250 [Spirochaetia bacterium]|nr:hypothetical protein FACS1894190_10250 [Spirochaetia bacterium]